MAAFWSDARNVSIHDGHAENQVLQELLHLVEQPLPKWVKKGPYPTTCIHLSYLVCELTNRKSSRHQTRSNRNDELASLFILALESTDTIRRCWSDGRKEYIGAHVIILITSIFRQLNPDCIALENAFVPLPKHPVCGYNPLMDYTPRFSVVPLMFLYRAHEDLDDASSVCSSEVNDSQDEPVSNEVLDGDSHSMVTGRTESPVSDRWTAAEFCRGYRLETSPSCSIGSGDKSSIAPLDEDTVETAAPPADVDPEYVHASIRPDASFRSLGLSAVLCMGAPDTIWGAIASTLYQRHVWGISTPVVGLIFHPGKTRVRVVFAWLEQPEYEDDLPSVNAKLWHTYDLRQPFDCIAFVHLLVLVQHHVRSVMASFDVSYNAWCKYVKELDVLCWRSDRSPNMAKPWRDRNDEINGWLASVPTDYPDVLITRVHPSVDPTAIGESLDWEERECEDCDNGQVRRVIAYDEGTSRNEDQTPVSIDIDSIDKGHVSFSYCVSCVRTSMSRKQQRPQTSRDPNRREKPGDNHGQQERIVDAESRKGWPQRQESRVHTPKSRTARPEYESNIPERKTRKTTVSSGSTHLTPPSITQTDPDGKTKGADTHQGSEKSKRFSASEFAAAHYRNTSNAGCMDAWMGQRLVLPAIFPFDRFGSNTVTDLYEEYTSLYKADGFFDNVQGLNAETQDELDRLYKSMSSDQLRFTTERALPPEVLKHVISCRSAILSSSREARKHKVDAERERLPEAEVRTAWDGLINACTRIPGNDDVKPRLERMLQLPRNDVHDMPTRSDFAKRLRQWESEVAEYGDHSSEKSHEDAARLYCIAEAAAQAALTLRSHSHELSLSGSEPKQAKCDGITAATLGNFPPEHITLTASDRSRLKKLALLPSRRSKPVSHTRAPLTSASPSADFKKAFDNNDLVATSRLQRPVSPSDDLSVALQVLSLDSREADTTSYTVLRDETLHASTSDSDSGDDDNGNDEDSDEDDNRDTEDDGSGSEDSDEGGDTDIEKGRDDEDIVNSDGNTPQPDTDDDEDAPDDKATNTNILLLPLLVQEYKKFLDNMQQNGVNQGRMDLIACIKFLSALGIHNFPVFSIITEGTLGTVCCAYMKDDKEGRIYEHNVRTFDVSNPVDAFNLATFLTFIVTIHKRKLMDQFTVGKQQELWQNFRDKNKTLNWAMSHQFPSV